MRFQEIMSLLDQLNPGLIVLLCHHNADPDALYSAFAFSLLLHRLRPKITLEIAAAQGPSKLSKHSLKSFPVNLTDKPHFENADAIVLFDTNTVQQLDEWSNEVTKCNAPIIVIDHHARHEETEAVATICLFDEEASSTCEIIYRFFKELGLQPTEMEAKAIFLGIAFDTKHFLLAKPATFKGVADLIDAGVNVKEAMSLLSLPMNPSERIARLKACRRAMLIEVKEWLIASSHVNSYQASVARGLIGLGAHVAIVAGQRGKKINLSMRSSNDFYDKTRIHLGRDIAQPLGGHIHGTGGGHSSSAGVNGTGKVEVAIKCCIALLKKKLVSSTAY